MQEFGSINGHLIGIAMKEMVRRAIILIRAQRFIFEAQGKGVDDFVTTADRGAQEVYAKLIRESFPQFGVVGEEDNLSIPCSVPGHDVWFTVDPLDGTKAFVRRQSHGIGTMISLVVDGQVVAAYVGDVMTQEVYGYRPGSEAVYRISDFGNAEKLVIDPEKGLSDQYLLLRHAPSDYSPAVRRLMETNAFKGIEVTGGSIGVKMARLWKGEVGAAIMRPYADTPWDKCPVMGISAKLGFKFLEIDPESGVLSEQNWTPSKGVAHSLKEVLAVHESRIPELKARM